MTKKELVFEKAFIDSLKMINEKLDATKTELSDIWKNFKSVIPETNLILIEVSYLLTNKKNEHIAIARCKNNEYIFVKCQEKEFVEMKKEKNLRKLLLSINWFKYFEIFLGSVSD